MIAIGGPNFAAGSGSMQRLEPEQAELRTFGVG
jgi:hypothetical protein